jgi:polysaccharide export outer membrane protein
MILLTSLVVTTMLLQGGVPVPAPPDQAKATVVEDVVPTTYTLGVDDQIVIRAVDVEEIDNKPVRIDTRGNINLPMAGHIQAAGLTTDELEQAIEERLKKYVNTPEVSVSIVELRSQPISVLGSVQTPGVHQLQGEKSLFEVLSLAGGLRPDAGNLVKITRRLEWGPIPLPTAVNDSTGQFSVASVSVKSIMSASNPAENITIRPNDVVSVPKATVVYAIGAVRKPGGFVMGENESLSALQVLSLAEGLDRAAATDKAKIMRNIPGSSNRAEIPVDLKKILTGKATDVSLLADDILFIPTSVAKSAAVRSLEAAIQVGTGIAIYR